MLRSRKTKKYTKEQIAQELMDTAQGSSHYGNALRVAKDFPCVSAIERNLLDKWLNRGPTTLEDRMRLNDLAIKIWQTKE